MRRFTLGFTAVCSFVGGSFACLPQLTVDPDAQLRCDDDSQCPNGFQCKVVDGVGDCVNNEELAKAPITIAAPLEVLTPQVSQQDGHNVAKVTVAFSKAPASPPVVTMDDRAFACTTTDVDTGVGFVCEANIDGRVQNGERRITMVALDGAKNKVADEASITVDNLAPRLVRVDVVGGGENVQAGAGATLTLSVILDETPAALTAVLAPGGEPCDNVVIDDVVVRCNVTIATDAVEGPRVLAVTARDLVDNESTVESPTVLTVDITPPTPPTVEIAEAVTLVREPWGRGTSSTPRFLVEASLDAVDAGATLAVFGAAADPEGGASSEIVRAIVVGDQLVADLGPVDRFEVFVAAIDAAGNSSPRVRVRNQRWTASFGGKVETSRFENPHQAFLVDDLDARLRRGTDRELLDPAPLHPGDGGTVTASPQPRWQQRPPTGLPAPRLEGCVAFDEARGQVLLFGGKNGTIRRDDTWLYRAGEWRLQTPNTAPPPRSGAACAYDSRRDRVILAGGVLGGGTITDEIWLWDGSTWAQSGARLPTPLADASATFDAQRGGVVVFGGKVGDAAVDLRDDTILIGNSVTTLPLASPPPPRRFAGFAAVSSLENRTDGGLVLFAGTGATPLSDTWILEESGWVEVAGAGGPANQGSVAMAAAVDGVLLTSAQSVTFRFDGVTWTQLNGTGGPGAGANARMVSLGAKQLLFAGGESAAENTTFVFDGERYNKVQPVFAPTRSTQAAFDLQTGQMLVLDSQSTLSVDDGLSLTEVQDLPVSGQLVSPRFGTPGIGRDGALVITNNGIVNTFDDEFNAVRDVAVAATISPALGPFEVVRFGANREFLLATDGNATWVLDGNTWSQIAGTPPPQQNAFAIAPLFDGTTHGVVVVAGNCNAGRCTTTSFFDGVSWEAPVEMPTPAAGGPIPFGDANAAAVESGDEDGDVIIFGGFNNIDGPGFLADVWHFDGTTFTRGPQGPSGRTNPAMAYQPLTRDIVVYGGSVGGFSDEVWNYHPGDGDRAGFRFDISVGTARVSTSAIRRVEASITDDDAGVIAPLVWNFGRFVALDDVNLVDGTSAEVSPGIFVGNEPTLHIAVTGAPSTSLHVDNVDVTLFVQE